MIVKHRFINEKLFIPAGAESIIIGTFPSVLIRQSFNKLKDDDVNFFYGGCDNYFWSDLESIYKIPINYEWTEKAVAERIQLLTNLRMAITDIIMECETDGLTIDAALKKTVPHKGIITILDENPTINTIYFTSGSGKINAESMTMNLLNSNKRCSKVTITEKKSPRIRTFIFHSSTGITRDIKSITLYSPSPLAKRGGVTDEKRLRQYQKYLPQMKTINKIP